MKTFTTFARSFTLALALGIPATAFAEAEADKKQQAQTRTTESGNAEDEKNAQTDSKSEANPDGQSTQAVPADEPELESTTQNLIHKLQQQIDEIDKQFTQINDPSSLLVGMLKSRKSRIEEYLVRINELAVDLAALQEEFNETNTGAYEFTAASDEERFKYTIEGTAAYNAMMNDLKEKNFARKALGLNKFEAFEETFKGIEGYTEAYKIYVYNVDGLQKKWAKALATEQKKRERYNEKKLELTENADDKELEVMSRKAEAAGYNMSDAWYNPSIKNVVMLEAMTQRATRTMREIEYRKKDKALKGIGKTSPLIVEFWAKMDEARDLMVTGNLAAAKKIIDEDPCFNNLLRLDHRLLPEEYCSPLRDESNQLKAEINKRSNSKRNLENQLENKIITLERNVGNAQSQIDAILEEIDKELALQNETDEEEATVMSEADRIKASNEADAESNSSETEKDGTADDSK